MGKTTASKLQQGKPNRIDRRAAVHEAMAIAQAEGVEGVSMRKLAARLGVEAASLYNHFPNRAAILRLVGRAALSEIPIPEPDPAIAWDDWMIDVAVAYRAGLLEHPYLADLVARGFVPWDGLPNYDAEKQVLADRGISSADREELLRIQQLFVVGAAMLQSTARREADSGRDGMGCDRENGDAREFEIGLRALIDGLLTRYQKG